MFFCLIIIIIYILNMISGVQRLTKRFQLPNECTIEDNSIQFYIECALQKQLKPLHYPRLALSSRTDSGVHAMVNTFHVDLQQPYNNIYQPNRITQLLNDYFIENRCEIKILKSCMVSKSFHSRKNAKWRSYMYRLAVLNMYRSDEDENIQYLLPISELYRCHLIRKPNFIEMEKAMNLFVGEHNLETFVTRDPHVLEQKNPVKTIDRFSMKKVDDLNLNEETNISTISMWEFHIQSKSFLYNQIRRMMGCIIGVGLGIITVDKVKWMLDNPSHLNWDPKINMAPPFGLWLTNIFYDKNDFIIHENLSTYDDEKCDQCIKDLRKEMPNS